ncbi:HAD family hydrolase [Saccharibacillus endophyticus]|uniref:HAD superfamily hydrolase n=1 Tax=Saccharibacillus endophyticus TaxID=2060666 RepID=A0ABQ2A7E6_9BACL|nr:HAD family hydrolase [Saccharibacillus endophyticus]GGH86992.1 HAD superfamily hydrolase [Saccharibacillus endophyticus]
MKVFIFDLDDTLYDELQFVKSGFRSVAAYLSEMYNVNSEEAYAFMLHVLEKEGRGAVFNKLLKEYRIFSSKNVRKCISIYRLHSPDIHLSKEAEEVLEKLKNDSVYIVTDGNKVVQANKIRALDLDRKVKKSYITYRYGRIHSKPSPYCFLKIAEAEQVPYSQMVYVGDNPNKDFVGIKPLGIRTIQIRQGAFYDLPFFDTHQAEVSIEKLTEIFEVIRQWEEGF